MKNYPEDSIGRFINQHSKRFKYLLVNRVDLNNQFQTYEEVFPDTAKISKIYARHLEQSDSFLTYFTTFLAPIRNPI